MPSLKSLNRFITDPLKSLGEPRFRLGIASFKLLAYLPIKTHWVQRKLSTLLAHHDGLAAEAACEALIHSHPKDPWVYALLGERYIHQERWIKALTACQKAIVLKPDAPWLHCLLGRAHMGLGDDQAAATAFQRAIDQQPNIGWFYYYLGEVQRSQGHYATAESTLSHSITLIPQLTWAKYSLGMVWLAQEKLDAALEQFKAAQLQHPEMEIFRDSVHYLEHLQHQEQSVEDYCLASQRQRTERDSGRANPKLDILLLVPQPIEPPNSGGAIRIYHQAKSLAQHHNLVLVSLIFEAKDYSTCGAMADYCALPLTILAGDYFPDRPGEPNLIHRYGSRYLHRTLEKLQAIAFDIVCFDFVYMAQYRHLFPQAYAVLGEHNIESEMFQRVNELQIAQLKDCESSAMALEITAKATAEKARLTAYENQIWPQFELRTVVSDRDQLTIDQRCSVGETWVVNNGIDTHNTPFLHHPQAEKILFFGTLDYFPNVDGISYFCKEIMPLIWQARPALRLCIAGRSPVAEVLALDQDPRIEIQANPVTIAEVARDCSFSVVPLRAGGGTRLKILHSMALGLPNISTQLGCEGLAVEDGQHLLIRDEPEAFAQAVLTLAQDRPLWERLRQQGRDLVEAQYDWQQIYGDYETRLLESWGQFKQRAASQPGDETAHSR